MFLLLHLLPCVRMSRPRLIIVMICILIMRRMCLSHLRRIILIMYEYEYAYYVYSSSSYSSYDGYASACSSYYSYYSSSVFVFVCLLL